VAHGLAPRQLRRNATTENFRHDENLAIVFCDCCRPFGCWPCPVWRPDGFTVSRIFSLFWRFEFPVLQTAGNLARKSFERLVNSPSMLNRGALKMLGNLKSRRDISLFSGNSTAAISPAARGLRADHRGLAWVTLAERESANYQILWFVFKWIEDQHGAYPQIRPQLAGW
jgi:hypothetical protein